MKKLIARQVKRLKNPLFLLFLVIAIGLSAYFLSGTQFFKGSLSRPGITAQNNEMVKVEEYVSVIKDTERAIWPIQAKKETIFEVTDKEPVLFTSERGYGTWRVLHSDFSMVKAENANGLTYQLTDKSTALGTKITEICINFDDVGSFKCDFTAGQSVNHTYRVAGTYNVEVRVEDEEGRSDSSTQTIEVVAEAASEMPRPANRVNLNRIPSAPKDALRLMGNFEPPSNATDDGVNEAAANVLRAPDSVTAPAGSTVYFEANCLYGEEKVRIIPAAGIADKTSTKPIDYRRAFTLIELNPRAVDELRDSKSAILDIFPNQEACREPEPKPAEPEPEPEPAEPEPEPEPAEPEPEPEPAEPEPEPEPAEPEPEPEPAEPEPEPAEPEPEPAEPEPLTLGIPKITKPEVNQIFTHTPRTVNIAWTEVENAAAYDLELGCDWCESNTDKWKDPSKVESIETAYIPGELPGDYEYRVRARAKNADITGEWSNYTYFSFDTAPKYECNDGKDNDGDGYIDFGADAGCKTPEDPDEENPLTRIVTACSDGIDNDADGYIDLADIGCEDANDVNEKNKTEPVKTSLTFKQFCHDAVDPKDFADITEDDYEKIIRDIIKEEASTAYNAEPFEGEPIFRGYPKSGDTVFKPDQAIRRDEVIKIVELATCLPEHLKALDEYSLEEVDFDDSEFDNPNYWASDYMYLAKNADIIDKGNVAAKVSRAEFLKILLNIHAKITGENIESCKDKEIPFVDVQANNWYCPYAVKAYEIGIAEGLEDKYGNLRLSPNSILTRIDAAIWLSNYYVAITGSGFGDTAGGSSTIKPIEKISR